MLVKWKNCTLSDLGEIVGGGTPSTKKEGFYGGKIPWITPKDLSGFQGRFIKKGERNITDEGLSGSSARLLPKNTVLFSSRAPIGYIAIAKNELATNQGFKSIVPNKNTDYLFLYYLLKFNKKKIEEMGSGSTFREVSGKVMKSIEVRVPEKIEDQRDISLFLGSIDNKIENNRKINQNLEEMANSIFDEMFPKVTSGKHIIGEYIVPRRGKGLLSKNAVLGQVPVVAGGLQPATYHNTSNTVAPVLTISASGANAGYVSLWDIPVWSSDSSFIDAEITKDVYFWYIMLKKRQQEIYDMQTGSAQPHIYPKHISIMPTIKLDDTKIDNYTNYVSPLFEKIGLNLRENKRLAELRDYLLPKLMTGELSVSIKD